MVRRLATYIIIMAWLFAALDWLLVHWKYTHRDERSWLDGHEQLYADVTTSVETLLCPPAMMIKPNFYFALMAIRAPAQEQKDLIHWPVEFSGNPLLPDGGPHFWWSEGRDSGLPWRRVHMAAWWLYWLPWTLLWWWMYAWDLFCGRKPWWIVRILKWNSARVYRRELARPVKINLEAFHRD